MRQCGSYGRVGGRSAEVGHQGQASNHLKLLSLRVMVVSVKEKSDDSSMRLGGSRQVRIKETNANEPLLTRR